MKEMLMDSCSSPALSTISNFHVGGFKQPPHSSLEPFGGPWFLLWLNLSIKYLRNCSTVIRYYFMLLIFPGDLENSILEQLEWVNKLMITLWISLRISTIGNITPLARIRFFTPGFEPIHARDDDLQIEWNSSPLNSCADIFSSIFFSVCVWLIKLHFITRWLGRFHFFFPATQGCKRKPWKLSSKSSRNRWRNSRISSSAWAESLASIWKWKPRLGLPTCVASKKKGLHCTAHSYRQRTPNKRDPITRFRWYTRMSESEKQDCRSSLFANFCTLSSANTSITPQTLCEIVSRKLGPYLSSICIAVDAVSSTLTVNFLSLEIVMIIIEIIFLAN